MVIQPSPAAVLMWLSGATDVIFFALSIVAAHSEPIPRAIKRPRVGSCLDFVGCLGVRLTPSPSPRPQFTLLDDPGAQCRERGHTKCDIKALKVPTVGTPLFGTPLTITPLTLCSVARSDLIVLGFCYERCLFHVTNACHTAVTPDHYTVISC